MLWGQDTSLAPCLCWLPATGSAGGQFCAHRPGGSWRGCSGFSFGRKEGGHLLSALPSLCRGCSQRCLAPFFKKESFVPQALHSSVTAATGCLRLLSLLAPTHKPHGGEHWSWSTSGASWHTASQPWASCARRASWRRALGWRQRELGARCGTHCSPGTAALTPRLLSHH